MSEYSRIQSEYARYSGSSDVQKAIETTSKSLKPMRAKTAPAEDLERERRAISQEVRRNMFLVQFALFILVASLLAYTILPSTWAHGIVFLLLCTGVATGFFLKR